ncbi:hypothetical protein IFM89_018341 [Coptis chinensis]|uniref:Uncharacterized protein n=1 Tax=Coptis chinensis TaxID=261450 RepID=A0A835INN1_9MAGN|nr:hypothetical protein IFM89_018341 [Coptis chinensis]
MHYQWRNLKSLICSKKPSEFLSRVSNSSFSLSLPQFHCTAAWYSMRLFSRNLSRINYFTIRRRSFESVLIFAIDENPLEVHLIDLPNTIATVELSSAIYIEESPTTYSETFQKLVNIKSILSSIREYLHQNTLCTWCHLTPGQMVSLECYTEYGVGWRIFYLFIKPKVAREWNVIVVIGVVVGMVCLENVMMKWVVCVVYFYDCKKRVLEKKVDAEDGKQAEPIQSFKQTAAKRKSPCNSSVISSHFNDTLWLSAHFWYFGTG